MLHIADLVDSGPQSNQFSYNIGDMLSRLDKFDNKAVVDNVYASHKIKTV